MFEKYIGKNWKINIPKAAKIEFLTARPWAERGSRFTRLFFYSHREA